MESVAAAFQMMQMLASIPPFPFPTIAQHCYGLASSRPSLGSKAVAPFFPFFDR